MSAEQILTNKVLKERPDFRHWSNGIDSAIIIEAMEQYATLKTSSLQQELNFERGQKELACKCVLTLQQENDKLRDEVAKLKKKHEHIRQVWISTDKSITKLKEAIQQYLSDKGNSYEEFEADYLTP